jgi:hypothetical protein
LEEHGHKLYGLWMNRPTFSSATVGPLPFGNVMDIPYSNWEEKVGEIQPDIIYATLNFGAVPLAHEVLMRNTGIPFIWHFKEGPFLCLREGTWDKMMELYHKADGKIYLNQEVKRWYEEFIPESGLSFILDGDLPKVNYFTDNFSTRISDLDREIHTVVPGRIIGIKLEDLKTLASHNIHIHLYTENYYNLRDSFNRTALKTAPDHYHLHDHCSADRWVEEFSKYDAGWLHCIDSKNNGNILLSGWDDHNLPARMSTLAAAGLPMIQKRNGGHIVAMKSRVEKDNMGVFFDSIEELAATLKNKKYMQTVRNNVRKHRYSFSFDYYIDDLIVFFRKVIERKKNHG